MLDITPVGQERLFILVNPIQNREISSVIQRTASRQIEPLAPARPMSERQGHASSERFDLLSAKTLRSLLDLDPKHPLKSPRPTD